MRDHGAQDRPLIIFEMGVVMPSIYVAEGGSEEQRKDRGDRLIQQFMSETFEWLLATREETTGLRRTNSASYSAGCGSA